MCIHTFCNFKTYLCCFSGIEPFYVTDVENILDASCVNVEVIDGFLVTCRVPDVMVNGTEGLRCLIKKKSET